MFMLSLQERLASTTSAVTIVSKITFDMGGACVCVLIFLHHQHFQQLCIHSLKN